MAFNIGFYAYAIIGHTRADQLLPQLLMEQFNTLNICMKEFGSEKIIFDKMQKKNNCVVRVKAEKTLGRVGRFFFLFIFFFAMAHMLDDKKRLSIREQFRILKVRSSAACSHFGRKIFSKTLTECITFNTKMGKKTRKIG